MQDLTRFPTKRLPDNLQRLQAWELDMERKAQAAQDAQDIRDKEESVLNGRPNKPKPKTGNGQQGTNTPSVK